MRWQNWVLMATCIWQIVFSKKDKQVAVFGYSRQIHCRKLDRPISMFLAKSWGCVSIFYQEETEWSV